MEEQKNNPEMDPREENTAREDQSAEAFAASDDAAEAAADETQEAPAKEETPEEKITALENEVASLKDAYLRLMAEFDNYRKNVAKEKQALLKYGGEGVLKELLPVVDDFERGLASLEKSDDAASIKEGIVLIYQKFTGFLNKHKVTEIPAAQGDDFDDTIHEAITTFPAPTPELKGKIIDCPTKGYKLDEKVIRFAKVVVGA